MHRHTLLPQVGIDRFRLGAGVAVVQVAAGAGLQRLVQRGGAQACLFLEAPRHRTPQRRDLHALIGRQALEDIELAQQAVVPGVVPGYETWIELFDLRGVEVDLEDRDSLRRFRQCLR